MQPSEVRTTTATALHDAATCHFHGGLTLVPWESIAQVAGARLRTELNAALRLASQELRREMEFGDSERLCIDQAVASADRAEEMTALYRVEMVRRRTGYGHRLGAEDL